MNKILDQIIARKNKEVADLKAAAPLKRMIADAEKPRQMVFDFKTAMGRPRLNLIAELKKTSPRLGVLREDFDPLAIAAIYQQHGAAAISVVTDAGFDGGLEYLPLLKPKISLPLLRKDFIIDRYQIYESIVNGADAVLLIAAILSLRQLKDFLRICRQFKLAAVIEVHNRDEAEKISGMDYDIVGINNRDLRDFSVDLKTTPELIPFIERGKLVISESGIKTAADISLLEKSGVNAVLIGETFMRSPDIGKKIDELMGGRR